jgi:hypothetical protein
MSASANIPNPEILTPKPDSRMLDRLLPRPIELDDRGIRILCIPLFGVAIPFLAGLFGPIGPASPAFWLGFLWFMAVSSAIWHGNRYLYLRQRQSNDWFQHPARRIVYMLAAIVFYTVPCSVVMLYAWYAAVALPPDWPAIRFATLTSVICVVFITHVYETVYLIRQRESDMVTFEKLERAKVEAELEALKNQLDPHFMFNSLNALSWLIENDPSRAVAFNDNLADVYRYILRNKDRALVSLTEELDFLARYYALLKLRFEDAIHMDLPAARPDFDSLYLPPISLQILLENAVKHNEFSREYPLCIEIEVAPDAIAVENQLRLRRHPRPTSRIGLRNLSERCRLILGRDVEIDHGPDRFSVRLPLKSLD